MSHHNRIVSRRSAVRGGIGLAAGLALTGRIAPGVLAQDPTELTLALDWYPNANHAGLYLAQERGYFDEAGLAVEIYTPENDAALVDRTEAAIALYRARDWDGAERAWREVEVLRPGDGLASVYLGRIETHRRHGVHADWEGTFELDAK